MFFLRVVVVQQRKVRHTVFQNLCSVGVTVKDHKVKIVIRLPGRRLGLHPFVPGQNQLLKNTQQVNVACVAFHSRKIPASLASERS